MPHYRHDGDVAAMERIEKVLTNDTGWENFLGRQINLPLFYAKTKRLCRFSKIFVCQFAAFP